MRISRFSKVLAALAVSASPLQAAAPVLVPGAVDAAHAARMADFLRFWNEVRLFGMAPGAGGQAWEQALVDHAGQALNAPDDAALAAAARAMLTTIDRTAQNSAQGDVAAPAAISVNGSGPVVIGCAEMGLLAGTGKLTPAMLTDKAEAARKQGLIFDCRSFSNDELRRGLQVAFADRVIPGAFRMAAPAPVTFGSLRQRYWDGYPPETNGSDAYSRGEVDVAKTPFNPRKGPSLIRSDRVVAIFDSTTPSREALAAMLKAVTGARVLAVGDDAALVSTTKFDHMTLRYRTATQLPPPGPPPIDACMAQADASKAMDVAIRMLSGAAGPACSQSAANAASVQAAPGDAGGLDLGQRMLALAKLWGTIRYFHPYEPLNDRDWETALDAAVPAFAAAQSRRDYENAVIRMIARIDDSHVWIGGGEDNDATGTWNVPIYAGFVRHQLVIKDVLADGTGLRRGDIIRAVDGVPVPTLYKKWLPLDPASTPQSHEEHLRRYITSGAKGSVAHLTVERGGRAMTVNLPRTIESKAITVPASKGPIWSSVAPGVGYIDLSRLTPDDADKALDAMLKSRAIIFDMRGYPSFGGFLLSPRLARPGKEDSVSAIFRRARYAGPAAPLSSFTYFEQRQLPWNGKPRYKGRVIMLVNEQGVSASEQMALQFESLTPMTVIGTPTQGADGDITSVLLPGGLSVVFSGHDVRHADGRQLQRRGIRPDILVEPTAGGIAAGRDEVLDRAIAEARRR